jgi:hypothetical protein
MMYLNYAAHEFFAWQAIVAVRSRFFHGVAGVMSLRLVVITNPVKLSASAAAHRAAADQ